MTSLLKDAARKELARRKQQGISKVNVLLNTLTPTQKAFVNDPHVGALQGDTPNALAFGAGQKGFGQPRTSLRALEARGHD